MDKKIEAKLSRNIIHISKDKFYDNYPIKEMVLIKTSIFTEFSITNTTYEFDKMKYRLPLPACSRST